MIYHHSAARRNEIRYYYHSTSAGRTVASSLTAHQKREAFERRERGEKTLAEIGRSYNVSGWTISRLAR